MSRPDWTVFHTSDINENRRLTIDEPPETLLNGPIQPAPVTEPFDFARFREVLNPVPLPVRSSAALGPLVSHGSRQAIPLALRQDRQAPVQPHWLGRMIVACSSCGALHWASERVSNSSLAHPKFGICCDSGQVQLPLLPNPPAALQQLFDGHSRMAQAFRSQIRQYNAALAFTSLGANIDHSVQDGRGPYSFRIEGELYHATGPLLAQPDERPSYAQLYFYLPEQATSIRLSRNTNLSKRLLDVLASIIKRCHQYYRVYRLAYEFLAEESIDDDVILRLRFDPRKDRRRYNLPTSDEIAVILPGTGTEQTNGRDILLRKRGGGLTRIDECHPAYMCLHYVLLFPWGTHGWHPDMHMSDVPTAPSAQRRLTQTRFYSWQLFHRRTEYSLLLRGGRLFQQYVVDAWAAVEQNRLRWIRFNQPTIRASLYSGLEDAILGADGNIDLNTLGQRYVLPSSFSSGPRYMQQLYQDGMAIARYHRHIDLLITMTANPQWREIVDELYPGQTAADRPDLVARVFRMKRDALINDIYKGGIFGRAVAYVYTVEFQKRGLPHCHILVFLDPASRFRTAADVDCAIRATWPDPDTEPELFELVKKFMVHGPCGASEPHAPCMQDKHCIRNYPKHFQPQTIMDDNNITYARPDDGRAHEVRGQMLDNRWIVPYCAFLLLKYQCHINVECALAFASMKYVHKYIYKGPDRIMIEVSAKDEIKMYLDARFIGACESVHRLLEFTMHGRSPPVVRLQVHLPGRHLVRFDPEEDPFAVLARASQERTSLTAYFDACADQGALGTIARQYTYQDFPEHFVWNVVTKKWKLRQRSMAIGRMYFVAPTAGEQFYLRTLLTVVKGASSFEHLRTVNGVTYPSFHDACFALGLLQDDGEWKLCLAEASEMQTGSRLRHLFATILLFCQPSQPDILWQEYRHNICDDLSHRLESLGRTVGDDSEVYDYGLYLLDGILQQNGHSLREFSSMPTLSCESVLVTMRE